MKHLSFTSKQLEELTKLKVRTQHVYVEAGIITPDVQEASGTGTVRYYSATNLMEAEIISYFIDFGLPKRTIASFFSSIKKRKDRPKLDPFAILKCDGEITLFILPDPKTKIAHHRFVSSEHLTNLFGDSQYLAGMDLINYDLYAIKIKIDLTTIAKRLVEKIETSDLK